VNVSAGAQRAVPRALVLALLVGGSGAFVAQQQRALADTGEAPGHQRTDLDAVPAAAAPGGRAEDRSAAPPSQPSQASSQAPELLGGTSQEALEQELADLLQAQPPAAAPSQEHQQPRSQVRTPAPAPRPAPILASLMPDLPLLPPDSDPLIVPGLFPVAVPDLADSLAAVPTPVLVPLPAPAAAPAPAPAAAQAPAHKPAASGRHAARTRPADSGSSAHRRPGERKAHSHRRAVPGAGTRHTTGGLNWTELARCEAGGNPHAVDSSGRYGGLYQFDARTWRGLGGHGQPQDASAGEQTERAQELYQRRGIAPWPTCGPRAAG
jgi:Transglycosylase-like domain